MYQELYQETRAESRSVTAASAVTSEQCYYNSCSFGPDIIADMGHIGHHSQPPYPHDFGYHPPRSTYRPSGGHKRLKLHIGLNNLKTSSLPGGGDVILTNRLSVGSDTGGYVGRSVGSEAGCYIKKTAVSLTSCSLGKSVVGDMNCYNEKTAVNESDAYPGKSSNQICCLSLSKGWPTDQTSCIDSGKHSYSN